MAISEEGNLDLNDTTFNKGLAMFMSSIGTPTLPTDPPVLEKEVIITGRPMLKPLVRRWDVSSPYNKYCPIIKGDTCVVGCVQLAVAQVMTFFKHPQSYGGVTFDWDKMIHGNDDDGVAKLLTLLGNSKNLEAEYGLGDTPTPISRIKPTFENFNYSYSDNQCFFNSNFPYIILNQNYEGAHPILISGRTSDNHGHRWVGDGVMTVRAADNSYNKNYVHCVWGWGGKANGYFLYSAEKDSLGGSPAKLADDDYPVRYTTGYIYNKSLHYIKDFSPN